MNDSDKIDEAVTRLRRIETRLTRYLTSLGSDTGARMPVFTRNGEIEAPGFHVTLADMLATVPPSDRHAYDGIPVFINGVEVATLYPADADAASE